MRTLVIAVCLALAFTALPAVVPAAADVMPVGEAAAAPPCIVGETGCIITLNCVREPCPSIP